MAIETLELNGKPHALIPKPEFDHLLRNYQMLLDVLATDRAKAAAQEDFPLEVLHSLAGGVNPIRVFRKYRSLRQVELAKRVGISKAYLSELEHGVKEPSVKVLKALAAALGVRMEDLTP